MSSLPPSAVMGLHRFDTDDAFLNTEVNENTDDLDTLPPTVCTSATRPATNLYQGRLIWESDTKKLYMYDLSTVTWTLVSDISTPWTAFTPNVYTAMGTAPATVSRTVTLAKYKIIGKTCFAYADCTVNATTTGGCGIDLPFTAKDRQFISGSMWLMGATTPADQVGIAYMNGDKTKLVVVAATNGFRDATSGATLRYNVFYELP